MSHPMGQSERTVLSKCPTLWDKQKEPPFLNVPPYGTKKKGRPIPMSHKQYLVRKKLKKCPITATFAYTKP